MLLHSWAVSIDFVIGFTINLPSLMHIWTAMIGFHISVLMFKICRLSTVGLPMLTNTFLTYRTQAIFLVLIVMEELRSSGDESLTFTNTLFVGNSGRYTIRHDGNSPSLSYCLNGASNTVGANTFLVSLL